MKSRSSLVVFAGALAIAGAARAAPGDPVKADALFREGQAALVAGDVVTACTKLADSWALDPTLGTLMHLAFCHEKQGRLYAAWNEFTRAAREANRTDQRERAGFAATRVSEIGRTLPRARLVLAPSERALALRVDGLLYEGKLDDDTVVVPGGPHTLELETTNHLKRSRDVTFPSQGVTTVRFDEDGPGGPVRDAPPAPGAPGGAPGEESGTQTLGFVVGGAGVVLLGVGTYFGIATFSKKDDAAKGCDANGCDPDAKRAGDLAHTYAALSTVLFAAGAVATGAGLVLVLTSRPTRSSARVPAASAELFVGPATAGVRATF